MVDYTTKGETSSVLCQKVSCSSRKIVNKQNTREPLYLKNAVIVGWLQSMQA